MIALRSASAKVEADLYVPADLSEDVSRGELERKPGALHERVNRLITSKPESALTAAIAKRPLSNCRSIAHVVSQIVACGHLIPFFRELQAEGNCLLRDRKCFWLIWHNGDSVFIKRVMGMNLKEGLRQNRVKVSDPCLFVAEFLFLSMLARVAVWG